MPERNARGKFAKGNRVSAKGGRRPNLIVEDYQKAFQSAVSPAEWKSVISRALRDAKKGNAGARRWLSEYLIGTPIQRNNPYDDAANRYASAPDDELRRLLNAIGKQRKVKSNV